MLTNPIRLIALTIASVWAAFWTYFVVASALGEPGSVGIKLFICVLGTGLFLGSALLAWRWPRSGRVLLALEGLALCVADFTFLHNPPATQMFLLLTLGLPPLLAGLLLLTLPSHPSPTQS